jgi:hypothetical protein
MPEQQPASSVALEVLSSLSASIPPRELASARGLLITRTHRAALGFGIQTGTAVALRRIDDGPAEASTSARSSSLPPPRSSSPPSSPSSNNWSAPLVFAVRRASFGVSYGYATVDSVLLLKTDEEARLLAAGAPAFGVEHRFVSSVLDDDEDGDDDDHVEVEVEGSGLDKEVVRSELAAAARSGEAAAASARSGEAAAAAAAAAATTTTPAAPAASAAAAALLPPARSTLLFSRSSGALVDMSVVAGMLSLDSAAHAALYCPEASSSLNAASAPSSSPSAPASPPPPPPEPEDVLAGKVERPAAFASVYQLLEEMEQRGQQQQQNRGRE